MAGYLSVRSSESEGLWSLALVREEIPLGAGALVGSQFAKPAMPVGTLHNAGSSENSLNDCPRVRGHSQPCLGLVVFFLLARPPGPLTAFSREPKMPK